MKALVDQYHLIIRNHEIFLWETEPTSYRLKAKIYFADNSQLIIKDYLFGTTRKYSFHRQDETGRLKIRWDNARHWNNVETFPHHKHIKEQVQPSRETTIEEVLAFIYKTLKSESDPTKTNT